MFMTKVNDKAGVYMMTKNARKLVELEARAKARDMLMAASAYVELSPHKQTIKARDILQGARHVGLVHYT